MLQYMKKRIIWGSIIIIISILLLLFFHDNMNSFLSITIGCLMLGGAFYILSGIFLFIRTKFNKREILNQNKDLIEEINKNEYLNEILTKSKNLSEVLNKKESLTVKDIDKIQTLINEELQNPEDICLKAEKENLENGYIWVVRNKKFGYDFYAMFFKDESICFYSSKSLTNDFDSFNNITEEQFLNNKKNFKIKKYDVDYVEIKNVKILKISQNIIFYTKNDEISIIYDGLLSPDEIKDFLENKCKLRVNDCINYDAFYKAKKGLINNENTDENINVDEFLKLKKIITILNILPIFSFLWLFLYPNLLLASLFVNCLFPIIGLYFYTKYNKYIIFDKKKKYGINISMITYIPVVLIFALFFISILELSETHNIIILFILIMLHKYIILFFIILYILVLFIVFKVSKKINKNLKTKIVLSIVCFIYSFNVSIFFMFLLKNFFYN